MAESFPIPSGIPAIPAMPASMASGGETMRAEAGIAATAGSEDSPASTPQEQPGGLDAAVKRLTQVLRMASVSVEFEIDSDSHRIITKVVDKTSGEVIRQIPTEEVIKIANAMQQLQGLFVHQTA
ncbi:flagellar protein FlaG [Cupriavidus sp. 2TAF22]|uniref:flagellar protein FlaG n=1 Tax=unclassified Cupriavidus TaxID=2640874 RepID=UPI003F8DB55D